MTASAAPIFNAWLDDFFVSYFRRRPVNATFVGMHFYDDRLPDFSESGMAGTLGDAEALLQRLALLPTETLSPSEALDRQLADGFLRIQRWESSSMQFGWSNPSLFTGEAIFGLVSLLLRPFAPLEERLASATSRLAATPAFLDSAVTHARPAPRAWIDRARRECVGARLLLEDVALEHPCLQPTATAASEAFARYHAFLETDLPATEDYACGAEPFDLLLRYGHFLEEDAAALERRAMARIAEEEEAERTARVEPSPPALSQGEREPNLAFSQRERGPSSGPYLARFATLWNAARELAIDADLLTFPDWPVRYVDQPAWAKRAAPYLYFLPYRSPAPLDDAPVVDYLAPPGADDSTIKLNHVVHHGSLGHHIQNWHAARAESRIGRIAAVDCAARIAMLCGGTMAEGWACYATDLADEFGLLTPAESHAQHRARVRMAARAVVDIRLHHGRFSLADAAQFYIERVGMAAAAARSEAVKNSLFPATACMYFAGWDGIRQLRSQAAESSLRQFHDRLLSFGSVPVSLVTRHMFTPGGLTDVSDASSRVPDHDGNGRQRDRPGRLSIGSAGRPDRRTGGA